MAMEVSVKFDLKYRSVRKPSEQLEEAAVELRRFEEAGYEVSVGPGTLEFVLEKGSSEAGQSARLTPNQLATIGRSIEELELSVRTLNCMKNANIKSVRELVRQTEKQLLRTKNFGRKTLAEIKELLGNFDLTLGMTLPPE